MKTTIKTRLGDVGIEPGGNVGNVLLGITSLSGAMVALELTQDQIGALLFGAEQAASTALAIKDQLTVRQRFESECG